MSRIDGTPAKAGKCVFDFLRLNNTIDQQAQVTDAQSDQLKGIFSSQRIVTERKLIEQGEDVETQERAKAQRRILLAIIVEML